MHLGVNTSAATLPKINLHYSIVLGGGGKVGGSDCGECDGGECDGGGDGGECDDG